MRLPRPLVVVVALLASPAPSLAAALPAPSCHAAEEPDGHAHHQAVEHPDPRPRVSGARVLSPERFQNRPTRDAYRMAREIPRVLDGLHCRCNCHDRDSLRSLLSCFENEMAATCGVCQEQAVLAHELQRAGRDLARIRAALDAKYKG